MNGLLMTNMTLPVPATCKTHAIIQFNSLQTCASIYPMGERHYIMYYVVMHPRASSSHIRDENLWNKPHF